jgi:hypothetical protein
MYIQTKILHILIYYHIQILQSLFNRFNLKQEIFIIINIISIIL